MRRIRINKPKYDTDLLEGPLFVKIVRFVIPLILTNLLQMCYSAADMIIVGLSGVEGAIGSIGTTNAMINLILNTFMGFALGTTVVVARNIGKNDKTATENAVHTSLMVAVISGAVCAALGLTVSRPVLALLGDQGHILDLATLYTKVYFLCAPFLAATNFLIAVFRAKGDTRTPLFVLSASGMFNVIMNLFFVLVMHMSVDGVALATGLSNALSAALLAYMLHTDEGWCSLDFRKLKIDRTSLKEIIRDGLPAAFQGAFFSLSNMLIQSSIISINNTLCPGGSAVIDGNAAAASIEGFPYTATNSVCHASVTFTSQHYGAKKYKRIGKVMQNCYLVTALIALIGIGIILPFRRSLIGLYVSDSLAVMTAETRMFYMMIPYVLLAWMEVGSGIVRGLAKPFASTAVTLTGSCILRVLWIAFIFPAFRTLPSIYLSYPVSWGLTALIHFIVAETARRRLIRSEESGITANPV